MHCWSCLEYLRDLFGAMGAGSSTSALSEEEQQLQNLKARLSRDLPLLTTAYTRLTKADSFVESNPVHRSQLERCFSMQPNRIQNIDQGSDLEVLLNNLGSTVFAVVFEPEAEHVTWPGFLTGYDSCCRTTLPEATRVHELLGFFCELRRKVKPDQGDSFAAGEFRDFLWLCWLMMYYHRLGDEIELPCLEFLVQGAFHSGKERVSVQDLHAWIAVNIPNLSDVLLDYVQSCFHQLSEGVRVCMSSGLCKLSGHLTPGRIWSLGLSQKGSIRELFLSALIVEDQIQLLYRSPLHGKGMNRFWSQVQGYREAVLFLVSGLSAQLKEPWIVAAIIPGGVDNKDNFYGNNNGCLISVEPQFTVLRASGREKNFVYTHKTVPGGGYNTRQLPNGIGFGGSLGNERFWVDDDFSTVTVRHQSVDKTYQPGALFPYQNYAPIREQILEVELWGLGGKAAADKMSNFQERERLFAEQRRKVDLKAFGNWQDSPEKMMMNMVSDPNKPRREER